MNWTAGEPSVLIYTNRKIDMMVWPFTTPEERRAAVLALFTYLDTEWEAYSELHDARLDRARAGSADAAYYILRERRDYEYETWQIIALEKTRG